MNTFNALIPIKEHSERVPGKNFRNFGGEPLFRVIVKKLLRSTTISRVYIDTDSEKVAEGIRELGPEIEIIWRPEELRGDDVSVNKIIAYDLSQIQGEYFLQTHCTNPLLETATIDKAVEYYIQNMNRYDSIFSVT
ncbi:MAG: acylneuraminate cytidylyltransferase family protein, partial [bacterium]|nr:acylneuraminate cytidylyltransferase family protein [bacterium]